MLTRRLISFRINLTPFITTNVRSIATKKKSTRRFKHKSSRSPYYDKEVFDTSKKSRVSYVTEENQYDLLREALTPLAHLPYGEQLEYKTTKIDNIMKNYHKLLFEAKGRIAHGQGVLPCPVDTVVPSPTTEHYRHKDEFNLSYGVNGEDIIAGMFVGRHRDGVVCVRTEDVRNMKPSHPKIAQLYEDFVHSSDLPVCLQFHEGGNWRGITVRSNEDGDHMAIVLFHPQDLDEAAVDLARKALTDYFESGPGKAADLKSLYFQRCRNTKCTREQAPFELLLGEPYIYEMINGLKFRISPDSFFQMNRTASELLYNKVVEMAGVSKATVVIDLCCGTGTIGLLLADKASRVIGIDSVSGAVDDAETNAAINCISNVEYHCGDIQKLLDLISKSDDIKHSQDVVAVLNPGRNGVVPSVITELRRASFINRLVYVSCNPGGNATNNFVQLCVRERDIKPFTPRFAVPVDLFPHADHCELVLLFER